MNENYNKVYKFIHTVSGETTTNKINKATGVSICVINGAMESLMRSGTVSKIKRDNLVYWELNDEKTRNLYSFFVGRAPARQMSV